MRADARRNRELILQAATVALERDGLDAQMADIAAGAGLAVGTLYRHFSDRDALLAELVRRKFARFGEIARAAQAAGGEPFAVLEAVFHASTDEMAADVSMQHALMHPTDAVWEAAALERVALEELMESIVGAAIEAGTLRADFRAEEVGMLMCGICSTMAPATPHGGDWRRHLQIVLDGLRARA